ncbi:g177 [Coccomyxa elongata]
MTPDACCDADIPCFVPALFLGGCVLLPWLWFANVWLFWPHLQRQGDPVVRKYAQGSAVGLVIVSAIFLPWMLTFSIGGPGVVGQDVFQKWNVAGLDLQSWGLLM